MQIFNNKKSSGINNNKNDEIINSINKSKLYKN